MVRASRSRAKGSVLAERGPDSRRQRKVVGRAVGHDSATFRTVRTKSDVSATERARRGLAAECREFGLFKLALAPVRH